MSSVWARININKNTIRDQRTPQQHQISFKDLIPNTQCVDSTRIIVVDFCYVEGMKVSSTFSSDEVVIPRRPGVLSLHLRDLDL
ncbi:hypothetical protein TNCV_931831 [Trichonephila clavipes]|nr:hypothetical protein TNCV_931831 [Trichonephila clavipes]